VLTFHRIDDNPTRITAQMDIDPDGFVSPIGRGDARPIHGTVGMAELLAVIRPTWLCVEAGFALGAPDHLVPAAASPWLLPAVLARLAGMTAVPLGEARDRLSEYVADVERTHERVTITRHGRPAAVLISADDLAAIEETLEILGTSGALQAIREGQADAAAGRFADSEEIRARYGVK